jgi:hypothetical protein
MTDLATSPRKRTRRRKGVEFGLVYGVGFTVFLFAAAVARPVRLLTGKRTDRRSIIQEARDSAGATIPYAFMG